MMRCVLASQVFTHFTAQFFLVFRGIKVDTEPLHTCRILKFSEVSYLGCQYALRLCLALLGQMTDQDQDIY